MMLKQSGSSRIQRSKAIKVKHALQICVIILTICIWFLYQVKKSDNKKAASEERPTSGESEYHIVKMGRKDLKPWLEKFEKRGDEEVEVEDEESSVEGGTRDGDELGDNGKGEEVEHDQLQDLMDDDVKDTDVNKLL